MLPFLALALVIVFLVALRLGWLDQLPQLLGRRAKPPDPDETRRLEVFREFMDGDPKADE